MKEKEFGPIPDPVQWHEGMLLSPHHFQQAWLRQEALLHYRLAQLVPFHFGVVRVAHDPALLVEGVFRVTALEAVMPDGLIVAHPSPDGADLEIDLRPIAGTLQDTPTPVHAVVPVYRPGSCMHDGKLARYRSLDGEKVVDENTGEDEQELPRLRPRLALHVGERAPQKFTALPLARIVYRDEQFRIEEYEPPRIAMPQDSPLTLTCRQVSRRLREKAAFLAQRMRAPPGSVGAVTLAESRAAIQCLVAGLPQLDAVLDAARPHPFQLYTILCGVAGHLSPLGPGMVPPIFDPYDHLDVRASFAAVLAFIERMIEVVSETFTTVAFKLDGARFTLRMEPAWLERDLLIGVRLRQGQSEQEVDGWVNECLIATEGLTGNLIQRRVRGARRVRVEHDDRMEIVPGRGILLYRIEADALLIQGGEILEITNHNDRSGARRPAEIILYVPVAARSAGVGA
ncbi:MAG TPA: type VI secretion system baseplate subunit TssK [Arenibaculum sp.]|nr:type VI secretion system baseplate subunit TssK [Arenibaculum sp.]